MVTAMSIEGLRELFDQVVREVTEQAAGISLYEGGAEPAGRIFTVHAAFDRGFETSVSFCAEESLFTRLTQYMMDDEEVTHQDVEDFTKEYFNMLCGRIASMMFQKTRVASRFGIPSFYHGQFIPEGQEEHFTISYTSDSNENARLIHHAPKNRQKKSAG